MAPQPKPLMTREHIARIEVGHTRMTRPMAWALTLAMLATIAAVPLLQHVDHFRAYRAGLRDSVWPQAYDIFKAVPVAISAGLESKRSLPGRILDGNNVLREAIHDYTATLEGVSVAAGAVRPYTQYVLTAWLGVGTDEVYIGRDGWLFYRPTIEYLTDPGFLEPRQLAHRAAGRPGEPAIQPDPRPAIFEFNRQLAERGIRLIVFPAPAKPMIYPEKFTATFDGRPGVPQNPSFDRFKRELEGEGILVFDPSEALAAAKTSGPRYLATDTHWRPEAVEQVAQRLGDFIEQNVRLPPVPPAGYRSETLDVTNLGDVARMLRLPPGLEVFPAETVTAHPIVTRRGQWWRPRRSADVLILGDSFANVFSLRPMNWGESAGLVEQLSYRLQRPLDAILRNGSGAWGPRETLSHELARGDDRLAGKRVVVWEFAVRELSEGDWRFADMTLGERPAREFFVPVPGSEVIVTGEIRGLSEIPRPGMAPYRYHIMAIHLTDVRTVRDDKPAGDAVVYIWSMQANVLTAAARFRVGQTVTLRLKPWSDVSQMYEAINRSELEDETLHLEEPCWGEVVNP